jgi:hypothetical protein
MIFPLPKYWSNTALATLGFIALVHSAIHFGTGELPEAILSLLLFLAAFSNRQQPFLVVVLGIGAVVLTWIVNSGSLGLAGTLLSGICIMFYAIVGFSRLILRRTENEQKG